MTSARRKRRGLAAVGLLAIATAPEWGWRLPPARRWAEHVPFRSSLAANTATKWAAAGILVALEANGRRHTGIWRRPRGSEVAVAAASGAVAVAASGALHGLFRVAVEDEGTSMMLAQPLRTKATVVGTAAVTEEVIHRGVELELLASALGLPMAATANAALFALRHVGFFGGKTVLVRLPATVALPAVYAWRRNLPLAMVTHFVIDAPLLLSRPPDQGPGHAFVAKGPRLPPLGP